MTTSKEKDKFVNNIELFNTYSELANHYRHLLITEAKPVVNNEPWKPKQDESFCYIDCQGDINSEVWLSTPSHKYRLSIGNCYPTGEKAEQALAHMKTHKKLQDLAFKLNGGVDIDWNNFSQYKHYLMFNYNEDFIDDNNSHTVKVPNTVYCLDCNFRIIATKEIGEQELTDYLKWEG